MCYLGSWANYRTGNCRYTIENIDASICTHIIYGFVGINPDASIRIMDAWLDDDSGLGNVITPIRKGLYIYIAFRWFQEVHWIEEQK